MPFRKAELAPLHANKPALGHRRPGARSVSGHLVLTAEQMREADRRTVASGTPGIELMERAGAAVADRAARMATPGREVLLICGPGNNGGDGFVAARILSERGHLVRVAALTPTSALQGDAAAAAARWTEPVEAASDVELGPADLLVDALFGTGLGRDLEGEAAALVRRVNASGRPVLAVDLPSGLDADTGAVRGAAIRADATVTFAARKPAHLLLPGRSLCGAVEVADIGIDPDILRGVGADTFANEPSLWASGLPRPRVDGHKYDRGHALVLSGGPSQTGAARLA
ncbi:MAG: NAD(P)H-hydrate epimerase, partial [Methylobacteriaceae bacterium]|nr:NAD(P)H-hydrate epimerase [Methylobacteriaceae bacterium]